MPQPQSVPSGYGDVYETYYKLNWAGVLPLAPFTKDPPPHGYTGYDGINPSYADMIDWAENGHRGDNTAIRLGPEEIGIDVDDYAEKNGGATLAEAEKRWGTLPPTYRSTSRDDGVSGIRVFRVPPGTKLRTKLGFKDNGLDLGGIEIIQWFHRYVMAWPSIHPEKRPYRWFNETTGEWVDDPPSPAHLADLPQKWLEALSVNGDQPVGDEGYDVVLAVTSGLPSDKVAKRLSEALADTAGKNRHDDTCRHVLALLRYGKNGEAGVKVALIALQAMFVKAVTAPGPNQRTKSEAIKEFGRYISNERAAKLLNVEPDPNPIIAFFQPGGMGAPTVAAAAAKASGAQATDKPQLWWADDLKPAAQQRWLAKNRIPRGAASLLIGDEGIGKSLLWVLITAKVTTGEALPEFGIPARAPGHVIVAAVTEDDWQTVVKPRLEVAGADTSMIRVICTDDDGSGAPTFPADMELITKADPKPDLVVVDAWLDTVPASLQVRDTQQARVALHPWKDAATVLDCALLLLCHTNRVGSANARDKYGATVALRQKARMTLFAQTDEDGNLAVGPEKANSAGAVNATLFTVEKVQHFTPTEDDDGIIAVLRCKGESTQTARQHLAANYTAEHDTGGKDTGTEPVGWLATLLAGGPKWANEIYLRAEVTAGLSKGKLKTARRKLHVDTRRIGSNGPWFWALPQHPDGVPDGVPPPSDSKTTSGKVFHNPDGSPTSVDTQRANGETWESGEDSPGVSTSPSVDRATPRFEPSAAGPGRCSYCGYIEAAGHAPNCQQTTKENI